MVGRDLVDVNCVGWADKEAQTPLRTDHIFRVFSNTKLITSTAALLLFEEGRLRLDDPIETFVPVLMFPILFGLSMDYEIFLVSRIYEEWHRRRDNTEAVAHGLAATGRTITAAAAIMVLVFASFILGGERIIELFGVGLASAILLDALIVRSVLVPALMILIGDANWKIPRWLDSVLPRLNVEGRTATTRGDHSSAAPEPAAG